MKKRLLLCLASAILFACTALSQNEEPVDLDTYIAQVNAQCPIDFKEGWELMSLSTSGDTVMVEMEVPSTLAMFLSQLTGNSIGAQRLWMKELSFLGESCDKLAQLVMETQRPMVLLLTPKESDLTCTVSISPVDLKKE